MKYKTKGNCPYCDRELDNRTPVAWAGSPEMFENYKEKHEKGHPENI